MVKNFGGNKAKGFARKSFAKTDKELRTSQDPDEIYAQVTKIYGGKNCQVTTLDGVEMLCHIKLMLGRSCCVLLLQRQHILRVF